MSMALLAALPRYSTSPDFSFKQAGPTLDDPICSNSFAYSGFCCSLQHCGTHAWASQRCFQMRHNWRTGAS